MQSEETTHTDPPGSQARESREPLREHDETASRGLLHTAWQKHRALTALSAVIAVLLLMLIIQNPAKTTVDLILWTVTVRQGVSLALMFLVGGLCGWVTRMLYRREHAGEHLLL